MKPKLVEYENQTVIRFHGKAAEIAILSAILKLMGYAIKDDCKTSTTLVVQK